MTPLPCGDFLPTKNMKNKQQEKSVEEIVEAIFKDSDKNIAVETKTETEFLHITYPAHISVSLRGDVVVYHDVPAKYATSTTVSEGAVDSREITIVEKRYTQSDVVKMLLQAERKRCDEMYAEGYKQGKFDKEMETTHPHINNDKK